MEKAGRKLPLALAVARVRKETAGTTVRPVLLSTGEEHTHALEVPEYS